MKEDEAVYFRTPDSDYQLEDEENRVTLRVQTAAFKDGNKWRFTDTLSPQHTFWAEIVDKDFLRGIDNGSGRFGKRDLITALVRRVEEWSVTGDARVKYYITKVIHHREAPPQSALQLDED